MSYITPIGCGDPEVGHFLIRVFPKKKMENHISSLALFFVPFKYNISHILPTRGQLGKILKTVSTPSLRAQQNSSNTLPKIQLTGLTTFCSLISYL